MSYVTISNAMIRTQVYLTEEQAREIKLLAKREQKHEAEIIRDAIDHGLQRNQPTKTAGEALLGLAEFGKKLNFKAEPNFSTKIDDYLYGDK